MGKERKKDKENWQVLVDDLLGKIREAGMRCKGRNQFLNILMPKVFDEYGERGLAVLYKEAIETNTFSEVFGEEEEEEEEKGE